jgi:hypothetical protein
VQLTAKQADETAESPGLTSPASGDRQSHLRRDILALTGVRAVAAVARGAPPHPGAPVSARGAVQHRQRRLHRRTPVLAVPAFLVPRTHMQGRPRAEWRLHGLAVHAWSGDLRITSGHTTIPPGPSESRYSSMHCSRCWCRSWPCWPVGMAPGGQPTGRLVSAADMVAAICYLADRRRRCRLRRAARAVRGLHDHGPADLSPFDPRSGHRWLYRNP